MKTAHSPHTKIAASASTSGALHEALAETSAADINLAKVTSIKAAIANGRLCIDIAKIADGLLASAHDQLSTPSK
ncbi:flagellar biosynthesis anti-sigma factor FlgM [Pandoraea sputorum]|uniref:flagellar biosynthesis anti-sigma factor FlgM n=1 Tax=Pandoraea sputorum TaxID=93222 RepID=UPI00123F43EC|nr:flagellar biosynthesis anti-sigma factor FlgM [Pandoraea sputorum]VVE54795.1 flagellar biosynthesis anti-sigma factor FlgM [Pandoraea sputorum]